MVSVTKLPLKLLGYFSSQAKKDSSGNLVLAGILAFILSKGA